MRIDSCQVLIWTPMMKARYRINNWRNTNSLSRLARREGRAGLGNTLAFKKIRVYKWKLLKFCRAITTRDIAGIWNIVSKSTCIPNIPKAWLIELMLRRVSRLQHLVILAVACRAHLHIVQWSVASYTTAAFFLTDYHLALHWKEQRLDFKLMLRWRAYTVSVQHFPSSDSSFISAETGQIH